MVKHLRKEHDIEVYFEMCIKIDQDVSISTLTYT